MLLLAALACEPDGIGLTGDSGPGDTAVEALPGDTSQDSGRNDDTGESDDTACPALYDQDTVPAFALELDGLELAGLNADFSAGRKEYHDATLTFEGEAIPVQVRLKGNPDFSWFGDKMQFVVSFNELDADARFRGLRKITFDATWYDPTLLRDRLSWWILRQAEDVPAACANNSTLELNGELYGTYGAIEYFDREYLERAFGREAATGTLWKYGTEPKANDDVADYDKLEQFWGTTNLAELESLGDPAQWVRAWAAEMVVGNDDGYVCCNHNFYLYDHPERGILFLPWDLDDTMDVNNPWIDPIEGYGRGFFEQPHFVALMNDPAWRAAYVDAIAEINALMDPVVVEALLAEWNAQIADSVEAEPHRTFTLVEREETLVRLGQWVRARHAYLEAWVACERGSVEDADGDGLTVCDDWDDGTALGPELCNGVDDDQSGRVDDDLTCEDCAEHGIDGEVLLFCSTPRTAAAAEAKCAEEGATLATLNTTESIYLTFFYSWPDPNHWWIDGTSGGECNTWNEAAFSTDTAPCAEFHPTICER